LEAKNLPFISWFKKNMNLELHEGLKRYPFMKGNGIKDLAESPTRFFCGTCPKHSKIITK